jgi:hypothetical protein
MTTEDRIRDAFQADAETVQPGHIRPLADHVRVAPARRGREKPWLRLAVPLAAAAAVAAIAVTFAALAPGTVSGNAPARPTTVVHPATGRLVAPAGGLAQGYPGARLPAGQMPRYFVGLDYPNGHPATEFAFTINVYSAATGKIVARVNPPQPGVYFQAVASLGSGQGYVAAAMAWPEPGCHSLLYRFHLTRSGRPAGMTPLAVPEVPGFALRVAGSADGSTVLYSTAGCSNQGPPPPYITGEISLPTGRTRTWLTTPRGSMQQSLSGDGRLAATVASLRRGTNDGAGYVLALGPRLRERKVLTAPGIGGVLATALSPNGRVMFALTSVLPASGYPPYTLRLAAYATATGRPLRTFLTERHQVESMPGELAADPSGRYLIVANFPLKDSPGNNPLVGVTLVNVASGRAHTIYLRQSNVPLDIAW